MKKKALLLLLSVVACAGLTAIYLRGESEMAKSREAVAGTFRELQITGIAIQKDVLKSRSFLLGNYDSLVESEKRLRDACARLNGPDSNENIFGRFGIRVDDAIGDYCKSADRMLARVELFKSKNAVIRNSMLYLTKFADSTSNSRSSAAARNLVRLTFQFSFVRAPEIRSQIEEQLVLTRRGGEDGHFLAAHAMTIVHNIDSLDVLVKEIVGPETSDALASLERKYQAIYITAESRAADYRRTLFLLCLTLLGYTIYAAVRLYKSARLLTVVNTELEKRVKERTAELNESLRLISDQQAQMVSTARVTALGEMAGQAAHEINTPLGALLLVADLIGSKIDAAEFDQRFYRKQMDSIVSITTKMARIVSSMRKLSSGTQNEPMSEAGLRQLLEETLILCEGRFKRASISFETVMKIGDLATVHCYPSEVSQVLINLLNNAHDAAKDLPEKWVRLEVEEDLEKTEFRVIDSGTGVPTELQEKIFEARFTTKSLDHGTGFGLSISRKIAIRHGGTLTLDTSAPNTTFVFQIPKTSQIDVLDHAS